MINAATQYSNLVELEDLLPWNSPELGAGAGAGASASKGSSKELIGVGKNEEISGEGKTPGEAEMVSSVVVELTTCEFSSKIISTKAKASDFMIVLVAMNKKKYL